MTKSGEKDEISRKDVEIKLGVSQTMPGRILKRLRISLNMKFPEIHDPKGPCRDITGLDRQGNGDVCN